MSILIYFSLVLALVQLIKTEHYQGTLNIEGDEFHLGLGSKNNRLSYVILSLTRSKLNIYVLTKTNFDSMLKDDLFDFDMDASQLNVSRGELHEHKIGSDWYLVCRTLDGSNLKINYDISVVYEF